MADAPRRPASSPPEAVPREIEPELTPVFDVPIPRAPLPGRPGRTADSLRDLELESNRRHDLVLLALKESERHVGTLRGEIVEATQTAAQATATARAVGEGVATAAEAVRLVATTRKLLKVLLWIVVPALSAIGGGAATGAKYVMDGFAERPTMAQVKALAAEAPRTELALLRIEITKLAAEAEALRRENQVLRDEIRDLRRRR